MLTLIMTGCAQPLKPQQRDDPLIGQIVDGHSREVITFGQLIERAASSDVVYLAERHDNTEHHQNQLTILAALIEQGRKPVVGFEFFDIGQTSYLMQYVDAKPSSMSFNSGAKSLSAEDRLRRQLGWTQRSDQDWNYYFQLIELARIHQLPVFGSDLPASLRLRLSRNGPQQLTAVERQQLSLKPLSEDDYKRFMVERFTDAHCGWSSEPLMEQLYRTWYERNYRMAASVVAMAIAEPTGEVGAVATDPQVAGPVVLILGAGHSEYNRAVVEQVAEMAPQLKQLNIGLQEIAIEAQPLAEYIEGGSVVEQSFAPRHDLFWFSQRQNYLDHCAELMKAN
ncbi:MAG: ChaN family lipoprotein [Motiliproteus sp.]